MDSLIRIAFAILLTTATSIYGVSLAQAQSSQIIAPATVPQNAKSNQDAIKSNLDAERRMRDEQQKAKAEPNSGTVVRPVEREPK